MKNKNLIILKLGGSLLTDKSKPYTLRPGILEKIAKQVLEFRQKNPQQDLIIINGNGSFGHTTAKKYDLHNGFYNPDDQLGFCLLQKDTALLNRLVVDSMISERLPAISFSPNTVFWSESLITDFELNDSTISHDLNSKKSDILDLQTSKNLQKNLQKPDSNSVSNHNLNSEPPKNLIQNYQNVDLKVLQMYLQKGFIPVLYGEVILDIYKNSTTISSDKLPEMLIKFFKKDFGDFRVINAGNYDGVLNLKQEVIKEINQKNYSQIKSCLYQSQNLDISGGMQQKILEFLKLSKLGVKSILINGLKENNIFEALDGQNVEGTLIN